MSLRDLYQEIILDHGKTPRNFGKLSDPSAIQIGHNPLCGDRLVVYVEQKNDAVTAISFEGTGCAISMASASLMTEAVKGKSTEAIKQLFEHFHQLVTQEITSDDLGKLAVFAGVAAFPIRVKCATLAWHTLNAAIDGGLDTISTE